MKTEKKLTKDRTVKFIESGDRLRKCLLHAGMKQKDLVLEMKRRHHEYDPDTNVISPAFVSDMVRGVKGIPAHHIDEIADILHVRREYLQLKSDYMTEDERIHDICSKRSEADSLCFSLLAALGYQIQDTELQPDGSYSSMHRPYCQITINKKIDDFSRDDTDAEILEKAHAASPIRIYKITTPDGKRIQVKQTELQNIVKAIQSFARFQIDNIEQYQF